MKVIIALASATFIFLSSSVIADYSKVDTKEVTQSHNQSSKAASTNMDDDCAE